MLWWLLLVVLMVDLARGWREETRPRMVVDYLNQHAGEVRSFLGNQTHTDHFKLLRQDGDSLLIGARNIVYNISLPDLKENLEQRITWNSRERDTELCLVKGKSEDDCNNYIRVLAKTSSNQLLVCGTNSYNPRCRYYRPDERGVYGVEKEFSGKGFCPYNPRHNSTSIFTDGQLYSGTVSDFSGADALIIKDQIRTEQYNLKHLNGPDFVGAVEDEDFVYFFFREEAVEFINCGKAVYSRVGRVCKNDRGGPHTFRNKWTTFLKTRLNCSVPGIYPFYFDEIQSITQVAGGVGGGAAAADRVFGVFNTPENSITGSAVCSFSLADIRAAFEADFKVQADANANWLPMAPGGAGGADRRPGACVNDSTDLPEDHLNFIKENVLMDTAVPSTLRLPHYIRTSPQERLTTIAVDTGVTTTTAQDSGSSRTVKADVLFVGTSRGRVLKLASLYVDGLGHQTNLIEELQIFPYHVAVNNILVVRSSDPQRNETADGEEEVGQTEEPAATAATTPAKIVVLSDHEVKSVPLQRCGSINIQSCGECVGLQDPYCVWNLASQRCEELQQQQVDASSLLQSLITGAHNGCPTTSRYVPGGGDVVVTLVEESPAISSNSNIEDYFNNHLEPRAIPIERSYEGGREQFFSERTLTLSCLGCTVAALVVGSLLGYLTSRRYLDRNAYLKCGHAYLEAQAKLDRADKEPHYTEPNFVPPAATSASVAPTTATTNAVSLVTKNNLLSNIPLKTEILKNNLSSVANGTLAKAKKIYL